MTGKFQCVILVKRFTNCGQTIYLEVHINTEVSLQFIADKSGVSKSLVSKLINGKHVRVSDETKNRVLRAIKEYNYTPNRIASGLRKKCTNILGCILPDTNTDFFTELAFSIEACARENGYQTIMCNSNQDPELERKYLLLYQSKMIDGMIIDHSDSEINLDLFHMMQKDGFAHVFVDRYIKSLNSFFVVSDGFYGSYTLTSELLKRGHKRIIMIGHNRSLNTSVHLERLAGYEKAMIEASLPYELFSLDDNIPFDEQAIYKKLSSNLPPTGIVLTTSWNIEYLLEIFYRLNLRVPEDCELATFDKFSLSFSSIKSMEISRLIQRPPIIAEQDPIQMGRCAVNMLIARIKGEPVPEREVFIRTGILNLAFCFALINWFLKFFYL